LEDLCLILPGTALSRRTAIVLQWYQLFPAGRRFREVETMTDQAAIRYAGGWTPRAIKPHSIFASPNKRQDNFGSRRKKGT
jgi:hypothetical protein